MNETRPWPKGLLLAIVGAWFALAGSPTITQAQLMLSDLTDLQMSPFGSDFHHIRIPSTGQLLTRIAPSVWQGNADIYPVDPRITSPGDIRRAGHYWSQFLMAGVDPATGSYFLTDRVESEGEMLQSFNVIQSSGKVIEYEGTWSFRNLFTTTAHHWVWVEGNDHYHRVRVSMDVLNSINSVNAIWTEFFNSPDAYATVTASTRGDGLQTRSTLGSTNQHYLGQYELGRDDWIAFTNPEDGQAGSAARVLLSSQSDIRASDEVTPIWADFDLYDNIELHVHRQFPGTNLQSGTHFFMDNLLITNPALDNTNWVQAKTERGKEWIDLIGPPIDPPVADPGQPLNRFFVPPGNVGEWDTSANWTPSGLPDSNDTAIIHSGRVATIDTNVGSVAVLRLADAGTGTLNIEPGASLRLTDRAYIGLGSGANHGVVNQSGGVVNVTGSDPVVFVAFDSDDSASYTISGGELNTGNLWFRFGNGTMTQTGGVVNATQLILGEGGTPLTESLYDLHGGTLNVAGAANIGKAPGAGDPFSGSNGSMSISGGIASFGDLLFGNDASDLIDISDDGLLRILQANYSEAVALTDIATGKITGTDLIVGTVDVGGMLYTQIKAMIGLVGDYNDDGAVDAADYIVWRSTLGSTTDLRADGNGNLVIDEDDYGAWRTNFGSSMQGNSAALSEVPEPISVVTTAVMILFLCVTWRIRITARWVEETA